MALVLWRGWRAAAVGALLAALTLSTAWAQPAERPGNWRLVLHAPPETSCPSAQRLQATVGSRLHEWPWHPQGAGLVVVLLEREDKGALRAFVRLTSPQGTVLGERTLRGRTTHCGELMDAVALTISIAMDPLAATRPPNPEAVPKDPEPAPIPDPEPPTPDPAVPVLPLPSPPPAVEPAPPEPSAPAPPQPPSLPTVTLPAFAFPRPPTPALPANPAGRVWRILPPLRVGAHSQATLNALMAPHAVPGWTVGADLAWGLVLAGVQLRVDAPGAAWLSQGAVFSQTTLVEGHACVHGWWMRGCAVVVGGVRHAWSQGGAFQTTRHADLPVVAAGPRLGLDVPLVPRRLAVMVDVDLWGVPLLTRLRDPSAGQVFWTQPPLTVVAGAGLRGWVP